MQEQNPPTLSLDHLVFGADNLERGTAWMMRALGVPPRGGGKHRLMGTHNSLWRLGDAYLEVIAIDPDAPSPDRPRWYGLDEPELEYQMIDAPRLLTWVLRTDDIAHSVAHCTHDPGPVTALTRGDLEWTMTVPEDGHPLYRGAFPTLIEWSKQSDPPSRTLPNDGLKLSRFSISGPPAIHKELKKLGAAGLYERHLVEGLPRIDVTIEGIERGQPVSFASL